MKKFDLNPTEFLVVANGSKWAGSSEDPIELLIERLQESTLDPRTTKSNFKYDLPADPNQLEEHELPFAGGVVFQGNFLTVSDGFKIITKRDSKAHMVLSQLVSQNMDTFEYQNAVADFRPKEVQ